MCAPFANGTATEKGCQCLGERYAPSDWGSITQIWCIDLAKKISLFVDKDSESPPGKRGQALFFEVIVVNADQRCSTFLLSQCGHCTSPSS